ncbi:DUF5522 domain-containing protein [Pedobacter sp. Du54]|uniref:DUF5522 domain-containing protein n=1 Tax=Pedobacter anseongensis TaxID=3133439 RepID=UPI00309E25C3
MEEEVDYYFNEDGLMVFTAAYHLKRGYCCKNKCKHCPWRNREQSIEPGVDSLESNSLKKIDARLKADD